MATLFMKLKNKIYHFCFFFALCSFVHLKADEYQYEGIVKNPDTIDLSRFLRFLPFNPIIIDAGVFYGNETARAAKLWPQGRVIAFEPNPHSFNQLQKMIKKMGLDNVESHCLALNSYNGRAILYICHGMNGIDPAFGYASSLLPLPKDMEIYCKGPQLEVPCATLDDWCLENQIDRVDLLRIELEGMELPVLQSSPNILNTVKIIYVKTFIHPHRVEMTVYSELKDFLEKSNFVLLSHRYQVGIIGHAIFLSRELFDAYYKLSLGIYLEN